MKRSLQLFLTTSLFITATTSIAMELEQPNILAQITCIQHPRYAQYVANNHVVITDKNGCSIVDTQTNTEIKKLNNISNQQISVHPNQKLFALFYDNTIDIYDVKKDDFIWHKQVEDSLTDFAQPYNEPYNKIECIKFNPHDTDIFVIWASFENYAYYQSHQLFPLNRKITNYDYITNRENSTHLNRIRRSPLIAISPTQHEIYVVRSASEVTLHSTHDKSLDNTIDSASNRGPNWNNVCEYSPDGSYIVQVNARDTVYIINSQNIGQYETFIKKDADAMLREDLKKILFYSNSILAILSKLTIFNSRWQFLQAHTLLSYWDIHTKELIHVSPRLDPSETYDFSFSPNKTNVIIALENGCVVLPVPFEVKYKGITEETFLYLLFLLKNYTSQWDAIEMPKDVNHVIKNFLLELYKRQ